MRYFLLTLSLLTASSAYAGISRPLSQKDLETHRRLTEPSFASHLLNSLSAEELEAHRHLAEPFSAPRLLHSLSADELASREQMLAPVSGEVDRADKKSREAIGQAADFALQGDRTVRVFLERVGEKDIEIPSEPVSASVAGTGAGTEASPAAEKTDKTAAPLTTITCKDGLYFDAEKGLLVYLKDVVLIDPDFSLKCDDQLKVYLHQEPKKKKEPKDDSSKEKSVKLPAALDGASFSGVDYISAMGNVLMTRKDPKTGENVEIRGQKATYNGKTGEIIVSGGDRQTVKQGLNITEITGKDSYIHVDPVGNVRFNGRISGKANMESLQKNKKGRDARSAFPGKK